VQRDWGSGCLGGAAVRQAPDVPRSWGLGL
jgi:hypothetical protein